MAANTNTTTLMASTGGADIPLAILPKQKAVSSSSSASATTGNYSSPSSKFTVQHTSLSKQQQQQPYRRSPKQRLIQSGIFSFRPDLSRKHQEEAVDRDKAVRRETLLMTAARGATFLIDKSKGDKVVSSELSWRLKALAVACYQYHQQDHNDEKSEDHPGSYTFTRLLMEDIDVMFQSCMASPAVPDPEAGAILAFTTSAKQMSQMNLWRI